ncbi:DUF1266 domain-containing protein [Streptomyces ehimensis]|uniref:DUF1266 domain-containing protein n=1 Tax=Streptomyces ehimensis TaxID=68195 RepID=A0ABV9BQE7_9ACTN
MGLWNTTGTAGQRPVGWAAQPAAVAPWQAPSDVEQRLYEARVRGDWDAYFHALAETRLFLPVTRANADAETRTVPFTPYWNPQTGTPCLAVFTEGMLPPPAEDPVFCGYSLGWYARVWEPGDPPYLVVNPGSPCEAVIPANPAGREIWQWHAEHVSTSGCGCPNRHGRLRALHTGGPLHGPLAHGLALTALLFVDNGELWNAMAYHGGGYFHEKDRLKEWWGITDRDGWREAQEGLLDADMVSGSWEFALGVRRAMAMDFPGLVDVEHWRRTAERVLRRRAEQAGEVRITLEGVTRGEALSDEEVEEYVAEIHQLIGRIARYEARFRADGLLAEGAYVRTATAWDHGRAAGMARWGLAARYCTLHEAEEAVLRAGIAAKAAYGSWEEFSAGYVLARCLHFDEEKFGKWYEDALAAHRILTTDLASPWLNIPWGR